jgi:hypothetical protein
MNARLLALLAILLPYLALASYVLATAGLAGFYAEMTRSASTGLAGVDLAISLTLVLLWMHADSRTTRAPFAPYLAVTLAIGVAGPLLYLIHRELRRARARPRAALA